MLVYAAQATGDHRKDRAIEVIASVALIDSVLPTQTLVEIAAVCRRKGLLEMAACSRRIGEWSRGFRTINVVPADVTAAIAAAERYGLAFDDAVICATARRGGATVMLSEDMHDGATYDGLLIVNPFAAVNDDIVAALLA